MYNSKTNLDNYLKTLETFTDKIVIIAINSSRCCNLLSVFTQVDYILRILITCKKYNKL